MFVCMLTALNNFFQHYCRAKSISCTALRISGTLKLTEFLDNRHMKVVSCQPYAPAVFTPREGSWHSFLSGSESTPGPHSAAGRIKSIRNSNDPIRKRTHDLAASSAVPQPTAPPCIPSSCSSNYVCCAPDTCTATCHTFVRDVLHLLSSKRTKIWYILSNSGFTTKGACCKRD
jgi:hypothetical protein